MKLLDNLCKFPTFQMDTKSISKSLSKSHSLNHHFESHLWKNRFSISFHSLIFLYLTLERHSRFLFLASEKSEIEDDFI
jgi:hypothetical protein